MKVTDKYIWTWGENGSWWRDKPDQPFSWESRSPGVTEGLRWVFAPGKYAENARARLTGNEPNLLKNPDFEDLTGYDATAAKPKVQHWAFWQSAQSRGTYGLDRGAGSAHGAFFANVLNACYLQTYPVKFGETYVFSAKIWRENPDETATLRFRWQDADGKWCCEEEDRTVEAGKPDADGWCTASVCVTVPAGVKFTAVLLGGADVKGKVIFDDAKLVKCP